MRYIHEYYHTYCNRITHVVQTWQTIAKLCKRNGGWRDCVSLNASVCLPARHQPMRWPCTRVWREGANFPGLGGDCECWTWNCCCGNLGFHCWGRLLDRHSHLKNIFWCIEAIVARSWFWPPGKKAPRHSLASQVLPMYFLCSGMFCYISWWKVQNQSLKD